MNSTWSVVGAYVVLKEEWMVLKTGTWRRSWAKPKLLNPFTEILENVTKSLQGLSRASENEKVGKTIWFCFPPHYNMGSSVRESSTVTGMALRPSHTSLRQTKKSEQTTQ